MRERLLRHTFLGLPHRKFPRQQACASSTPIVSPAMTAYNNCGSTECGASLDRALPEELMQIPLAVQRKRYLENSGPSVFGVTRMQKVASPTGETFIFLGAREGQVFLERTEKQKGEPFLELDSSEFRDYTPQK